MRVTKLNGFISSVVIGLLLGIMWSMCSCCEPVRSEINSTTEPDNKAVITNRSRVNGSIVIYTIEYEGHEHTIYNISRGGNGEHKKDCKFCKIEGCD